MTITVIVPVHNAKPFLDECVNSVLCQKADTEIILVEDGSTDGSAELCRHYAEKYPQIISLENRGKGVSEARNTGIEAATGDFITFLDADDSLAPDALATMADAMKSDGSDIVVAQFKPGLNDGHIERCNPLEAAERTLYQRPGYHESAWGKLYRRELFAPDVRFVPDRRYEDLEFFIRPYLKAQRITILYKQIYNYRINPASFLNNWTPDRTDALWAVDKLYDAVPTELKKAALSRRFSAYYNIFKLAVQHGDKALADSTWREIAKMRSSIRKDLKSRPRNRIAALLPLPLATIISKL